MKSTYKLLGAFWDGLPCETEFPEIIESISKDNVPHLPISSLLSLSSMDDVQNKLAKCGTNRSVIVEADFYPRCSNKVMNVFYNKRIHQIITYLNQNYDEVLLIEPGSVN